MAFIICEMMRGFCNQGKTIVCTIHQPSSEIFELFDTYVSLDIFDKLKFELRV